MYCWDVAKALQILPVDKFFTIVMVHRMPSRDGTKHF